MLDESELRQAVDLQKRSYGLLKWVAEAIQKRMVLLDRVHRDCTAAESARDWLLHHATQIPARFRPQSDDPADVNKLAHMFASYLTTSFDLVPEPGTRLASNCGCFCPLCTHLEAAPNLKAKKIRPADKDRARLLKLGYLRNLALSISAPLSDDAADTLITDPALADPVALATYGLALIRRCGGHDEGVAILVLWRQFAWTKAGSPKKDFQLTADAILDAERRICARIAA